MTEEQTLVCEHGLRAVELSAWHDGDLSDAEMRHVGDHLAECPAARAHLADYDALIAALRAQRVPTVDERLWQRVSDRATATPAHAPAAFVHRHPLAISLGTLGTVAALLALVLGFARLLMPGPQPGPTTYPGWTAATFPRGFTLDFGSLAVVDGDTAYACVTALDQQQRQKATVHGPATQFWVTHDRGQTWTRRANPPFTSVNQCSVTVDGLDPNVVTIWGRSIPLHSGGLDAYTTRSTSSGSDAAVTYDGGASWQQPSLVANSSYNILQHTTLGGTTYALICCDTGSNAGARLVASYDSLATWQPIDGAIVASGQHIAWFTVAPTTGAITTAASNPSASTSGDQHLWQSGDDGGYWSKLPTPTNSPNVSYVVQQSGGAVPEICATSYADSGAGPLQFAESNGIVCSTDGGHSWVSHPLPPIASCLSSAGYPNLQTIAPNGDLYENDGGCTDTLYRLPFNGDTWQAVATAPTTHLMLTYYPTSGLVWTMPRITDAYTQVDPTGYVYTRPTAL